MSTDHICASGHTWRGDDPQATVCPICTSLGCDLLPPAPRDRETLPDIPGYVVLEPLGRGGMGVVYLARQHGLNRLAALKLIPAGFELHAADRGELAARFRTEAAAIARLSHPNIVQVYEVGEWFPAERPPVPFLAMEYVAGGSLGRRLSAGPLAPPAASGLSETLARAVQAAHEKGVVHRDLKPDNVLLAEDGTPKVADFGLARFIESGPDTVVSGPTRAGAVLGTPSFMAPEQARPDSYPLGPGADVWALGAILYCCLTGRPPFLAATVHETLRQVAEQDPVAPSRLNPRIPRDLETVCLKCLRKAPTDRYLTAKALADDLERFRLGRPVVARPVGRAVRAWRWVRRNPLAATSLATAALAVVVGLVAVTLSWRAERRQRRQAESSLRQTRELLGGVVGQVYDDLRLPDTGREPFPPAMATDMLRQLVEYQQILRGQPGAERELARSETWRGLLLWAAGRPKDALSVLRQSAGEVGEEAARDWHALALMQRGTGQADEAEKSLRHACELAKEGAPAVLAAAFHDLGRAAYQHRRLDEAARWLSESATAWDRVLAEAPAPARRADRAGVEMDLGRLRGEQGDAPKGLKHLEKARGELAALTKQAPGDRRFALALSTAYQETGRLLLQPFPIRVEKENILTRMVRSAALGRAVAQVERGREVQANLARLSNEPITRAWLRSEIQHALLSARAQLAQRQVSRAREQMGRALPMLKQFGKVGLAAEVKAMEFRFETYLGISEAMENSQADGAKAGLRRAVALMKELGAKPLPDGAPPREMGETAYTLAAALRNVKLSAEAIPAARQAAEWQRGVLALAPTSRDLRKELSRTLYELGGEYRQTGAHAEAAAVARERAALWADDADELHDVACELCMCARVASADQKLRRAYHDEAVAVLSKAVAVGLKDARSLRKDGDFTPLRDRPEFQKLLVEVEKRDRE